MKGQVQLFNIPEKFNIKRRKPLFYLEIIEESSGEKFIFWKRACNLGQAKKLAAIEYNTNKGFIAEAFVKFGKVKEV